MNRWLLLSLSLMACRSTSREGTQEPTEARVPVTAAPASASFEAPAPAIPPPPKFRIQHRFQGSVQLWEVGPALIACSQCNKRFGRPEVVPRTWLVRADSVVEDPTLLPKRQDLGEYPVRFVGHYPDTLYAIATFGYEETGYDVAFRRVLRGGTPQFVRTEAPRYKAVNRLEGSKLAGEDAVAFARYEEEERSSKPGLAVPIGPALAGHGGPLVIIDYKRLARWDGSRWERTPAPWCGVHDVARLSNGSSLIFSWSPADCQSKDINSGRTAGVVYWLSSAGAVQLVDIRAAIAADETPDVWGPVAMGNEIWLIVRRAEETILMAPVNPAEVSLPDLPSVAHE